MIATSALKGAVALANKFQPTAANTQAIDCNGGAATATLDFTTYDTFLLVLSDSGDPASPAVLDGITLTTATGDADREVKKGARFTITVKADPGQTGGCGMDVGAFPASVKGIRPSDEVGCRFDQNDASTFVLEQVGTPGTPAFVCISATHTGRRKASIDEFDFAWLDPATGARTRGTGEWASPRASYGGEITFVLDIDVPACAHGDTVDWSVPFPELGAGPVPLLPLLRYSGPLDASKKLHSRALLEITDVVIYFGAAASGVDPPQAAGSSYALLVTIAVAGTGTSWVYGSPAAPGGTGLIRIGLPGSSGSISGSSVLFLGANAGGTSLTLQWQNTDAAKDASAGRVRIVLRGHEV